ncbi:hypothetical protein KUCAC02_023508 [Chaenocephalus aceratus]|uniref:Uncharacterized protein n=1 Tax=Chaenocephalus aceratus TaxID=36190 RepID=A0ACB9XR61_CHAAC|nr:hypothetical protein KUCAC02_023508 [Chaenocephalus aceratus]
MMEMVLLFEQIYGTASTHLWGTNRCGGDKRRDGVRLTETTHFPSIGAPAGLSHGAQQITDAADNAELQQPLVN